MHEAPQFSHLDLNHKLLTDSEPGQVHYTTLQTKLATHPNTLTLMENTLERLTHELGGSHSSVPQNLTDKPRFIGTPLQKTEILDYHAVILTNEQALQENRSGIFVLPGVTSPATQYIGEIKYFLQQEPQSKLNVAVTAALSSSVSIDTMNARLPSREVRGVEQGIFIAEIARRYNLNTVFLVCQSLAGVESAYVARGFQIGAELQSIDNKIKIGGLILSQPGGQYDHTAGDIARFLSRVPRFLSGVDEARQLFPSKDDIIQVQNSLQFLAQKNFLTQEEIIKRQQLEQYLAHMQENQELSPLQYLSAEQQRQLAAIDQRLAGPSTSKKEHARFKKRRLGFLNTVIAEIFQGADIRKPSLVETVKLQKNTISAITPDIFFTLPENIRKLINYPVAFYYGFDDVWFPSDLAYLRQRQWEVKMWRRHRKDISEWLHKKKRKDFVIRERNYLPQAPLVIRADASISHIAAATDAPYYGEHILGLIRKMDNFTPDESGQVEIQLHY